MATKKTIKKKSTAQKPATVSHSNPIPPSTAPQNPIVESPTIEGFLKNSIANAPWQWQTGVPVPFIQQKPYGQELNDDILLRQIYAESAFNPNAVSKAGYKGLGQIGKTVINEYKKATGVENVDPFNINDNLAVQKWAMNNLYNASFINKSDQDPEIRLAKTLAAYNWGRGHLSDYLNEQKNKGVDIYNSKDWINGLPKETKDYIEKILYKSNDQFNDQFKKAIENDKYKSIIGNFNYNPNQVVIDDNRGQWEYPGEVTRIASNDITMKGVPYPVLGVGADGEQRMMYPNEEHTFNQGPVTEYPMMQAQNGGWLSEYQKHENLRADGTKKGTGYFGILDRPDGGVSTEISMGVEFDGKEVEIPTMVPTLTKEELDYLLTNPVEKEDLFHTPMGESIANKAIEYARQRMSKGLNPFYQEGEERSGLPRHLQNPGIASVYEENNKPDWTNVVPEYNRGGVTWLNEYAQGGKVSKEELEYLQSITAEDFQSNPRNTEIERQKAELAKKTQMSETSLDLEKEIAKQSLLSKLRELSGKNEEPVDYYKGSTAPREIIKNNYIYANPGDKVVTTTEGTMPRIKPVNAVDDGIFLAFADAVNEYKELYPNRPVPRISSGLRTRAEQEQLYANRGSNRYPVAKPGTSKHELGKALDIVFDGGNDSDYQRLAALMSPRGFKWLGDYDKVHFEVDPNYPKTDISESGNIMITNQMPSMQLDVNRPAPRSFKNGGWLNEYQSGTTNTQLTPNIQINNSRYGSPGTYRNDSIVAESTGIQYKPLTNKEAVIKNVQKSQKTVPQTTPNSRVVNQNKYIQNVDHPSQNYAIVDKNVDSIYYFNNVGNLIGAEPVITGASNNERDYGLSMKEWMEKTGSTNHEDYFKYLQKIKGQTTPSGKFTIGSVRYNTAENPDLIGNLYNQWFRPERAAEIKNNRLRDYGAQQKLFTLISEYGIPQSKALHGTMNQARINNFNNSAPEARDMSNGCINVNGESMCFDVLGENSQLTILPESSNNIIKNKQNSYPINLAKQYHVTRTQIANQLKERGIEPTDDAISFIASVAQKETKNMGSKSAKLEEIIPFFSKTLGPYQINSKTFSKYLPSDYTPENYGASAEAVYNFYNEQKKNGKTPVEMYREYSGSKNNKYDNEFEYIYNVMNSIYSNGGKIFSSGGEKHRVYEKESPTGNGKGVKGHIMVTHPTMDKGKWDTIDLTKIAGAKTVAQGVAATKKWHAENPEYQTGGPTTRYSYVLDDNNGNTVFDDNGNPIIINPTTNYTVPEWLPQVNITAPKIIPSSGSAGSAPQSNGSLAADIALDGMQFIPGPLGAAASAVGVGKNLYEGDYVGAGLDLANLVTMGGAKWLTLASDLANAAAKANKARRLARQAKLLEHASNPNLWRTTGTVRDLAKVKTTDSNPEYKNEPKKAPNLLGKKNGGWLNNYK